MFIFDGNSVLFLTSIEQSFNVASFLSAFHHTFRSLAVTK